MNETVKEAAPLPVRSNAGLGSAFQQAAHHAYAQTDGTYAWPNSREGDMLREAKREIEVLRAALVECEHQTHSMRVWGGQSWTYHPPQAGKIAKFARAALDVPNV
ncbi:MAG: hypothetical protein ACYC2E_13090 [Sulfuricella sp.]